MVGGVVIVYARGLESNALVEYAARRGWTDVYTTSNYGELMRTVRSGRAAAVLCSGLSGLGKNLPELASVIRELSSRGIALIIPSLGIVDAASRQTLLNTMGCVLESKAAIATERTTHGLARAKRRGVKLGRPRIPPVHRGEVARLRAAGMSGRKIAEKLSLSLRSVFNVLRRGPQPSRTRHRASGAVLL